MGHGPSQEGQGLRRGHEQVPRYVNLPTGYLDFLSSSADKVMLCPHHTKVGTSFFQSEQFEIIVL